MGIVLGEDQDRRIPLGQLAERIGELPADRPVVTVCRSGARSRQAAALLAREREIGRASCRERVLS